LHSLILNVALARGARAAVRYAVAPLLSDLVPVLLSLLLAHSMPARAARLLAVLGGTFVVYLGVLAFRRRRPDLHANAHASPASDYFKGALTNMLNPHPWIFWLGAGAPLLRSASARGGEYAFGWLLLFYFGLVGTKSAFALALGAGRRLLSDRWLSRLVVVSAVQPFRHPRLSAMPLAT
jgi:threonine/homoserine/homoserine lactone efflux protein